MLEQLGEDDPEVRPVNDIHGLAGRDVTEEELIEFLRLAGFVKPDEDARQHSNWHRWLPHRMALSWQSEEVRSGRSLDERADIRCPVLLVKGTVTADWLKRVVGVLGERLPHATVLEHREIMPRISRASIPSWKRSRGT